MKVNWFKSWKFQLKQTNRRKKVEILAVYGRTKNVVQDRWLLIIPCARRWKSSINESDALSLTFSCFRWRHLARFRRHPHTLVVCVSRIDPPEWSTGGCVSTNPPDESLTWFRASPKFTRRRTFYLIFIRLICKQTSSCFIPFDSSWKALSKVF